MVRLIWIPTSSLKEITTAVSSLYDRIIDKELLIRRLTLSAAKVMPKEGQVYQQLDLFTDYEALKKEQEKERRLQKSILDIKKKYGKPSAVTKMNNGAKETAEKVSAKTLLISSGLIIIMLAVVMQGFLRDGIATWMPAYLSDVFSLSNEISILTTVILPIFSIFSAYMILAVRNKLCRNELKLAGITFLTAVAAIGLLMIFRANMPLSVLLLALTSACSHAVNFLLICLVPKRFEQYGRFSLVTGLINSCTYIGAAISTYGFAAVSESCGWNVTLILWGAIALTGFVCCFAAKRKC